MERMAAAALTIASHFALTCTFLHALALTRGLLHCLALILHWLLHLDVHPVQIEIKVGKDTHCSVVDLKEEAVVA